MLFYGIEYVCVLYIKLEIRHICSFVSISFSFQMIQYYNMPKVTDYRYSNEF